MQENEKEANNMPEVKDKITGEVVAEFDYDANSKLKAEKLADSNINYEVNYAPGGEYNAPDMRENYHLGGKIPGQQGFGERPITSPLTESPIVNPLSESPIKKSPLSAIAEEIKTPLSPIMEEGGKIPKYKKGGKVEK